MTTEQVRVWEEVIEIPTYGVGEPDKNPMFLEKRVYQGSSGRVYPYPVIDKIKNEKKPHPYQLVCLENEYLHIEIMPQVGGRISSNLPLLAWLVPGFLVVSNLTGLSIIAQTRLDPLPIRLYMKRMAEKQSGSVRLIACMAQK